MSAIYVSQKGNFIDEGLITSQTKSQNGIIHYYGFEEIRKDNLGFWLTYAKTSRLMADVGNGFCEVSSGKQKAPPYSSCGIAKAFNLSEEQWELLKSAVRVKGWKRYKKDGSLGTPFFSVSSAAGEMADAILQTTNYTPTQDRKIFLVYLSKVPIQKRHVMDVNLKDLSQVVPYWKTFGHIVLSLVCVTKDCSADIGHVGVFRNPLSFLEMDPKYKEIAMKVHGFSAHMVLSQFQDKKDLSGVFTPTMSKIMYMTFALNEILIDDQKMEEWKEPDRLGAYVRISLEKLARCFY